MHTERQASKSWRITSNESRMVQYIFFSNFSSTIALGDTQYIRVALNWEQTSTRAYDLGRFSKRDEWHIWKKVAHSG